MNFRARCLPIRLMLVDVDGVLTDGGVTFDEDGRQLTQFNIQDGLGMRLWRLAGHTMGVVTGRTSAAVRHRAEQLSINIFCEGIEDKWRAAKDILDEHGFAAHEVCYVGDDLPDVPVIRRAGLGVAVANARLEVRQAADWVTAAPGGRGAVREVIETVLKLQGRWSDVARQITSTQSTDG
jgi:3-deoxy-D-manno-octulosonate 8-phosphate phosphatase (KDO 8-P phosphatase)